MNAIHCIVSPYLDIFQFEEWINYHLDFGFEKFFIYDLGYPTYNVIPVWRKENGKLFLRQEKRFSPKIKNEEVACHWEFLMKKNSKYVEYQKVSVGDGKQAFFNCQNSLISSNLKKYASMKINWLANIDADELISGNIKLLKEVDSNIGRVRLSQKIFENVRQTRSFKENRSFGPILDSFSSECYKNIVRPHSVFSWNDPHYSIVLHKEYKCISGRESLYLEHHCGRKHKETPACD